MIEDEPGVRMTLGDRLTAEGYEVVSREDGPSGQETAINGSFDLILLDIMLPGRDGFAVCENIRKKGITTPGRIISRGKLLDEVWGYDSETSSRTVDVHIAKIRQKLGESEIPRHILTVRGRGYKFLP